MFFFLRIMFTFYSTSIGQSLLYLHTGQKIKFPDKASYSNV